MSTELCHIEEAISLQEQCLKEYLSSMDTKYLNEGRVCYEFEVDGLSRNELFDCMLFIDTSATRDELIELFKGENTPFSKLRFYPKPSDTNFINRYEQFGIMPVSEE